MSTIFLFTLLSCNQDNNITPLEPEPVCEMFFKDTSFFETIGTKDYQIYRICAPINFLNEVYLFEDIGYMSEKRQYLFLQDTVNKCLVLDLYEKRDWLSGDRIHFYEDYKSKQKGIPDQVLVLGKYYSINSCGTEWTIKFRSSPNPREGAYFDVIGGPEIETENALDQNGFKTITIKKTKDSPIKKGQVVRGTFFMADGSIKIEALGLP